MDVFNISLSAYNQKNIALQNFSLPSSVIYYIKNNNTVYPKGHLKAIESCKYFYSKKIFIVPFFDTEIYKCDETGKNLCITTIFNQKQKITLCLDDITFNVWLTGQFCSFGNEGEAESFAGSFIKNVKKSNIVFLALLDENFILDDLKVLLCQNIIAFQSWDTIIKYKDGRIVPIDRIFASLPDDIEQLDYKRSKGFTEAFKSDALQNFVDMIHSSKLTYFCFRRVHRDFEIEPFLNLIKKRPEISYIFDFRGPLPKNKIKELRLFVKNIVEPEIPENPIPLILYSSQKLNERDMLLIKADIYDNNRRIQNFFNLFEDVL